MTLVFDLIVLFVAQIDHGRVCLGRSRVELIF